MESFEEKVWDVLLNNSGTNLSAHNNTFKTKQWLAEMKIFDDIKWYVLLHV